MSLVLYAVAALVILALVFMAAIHLGFKAPRMANQQTPKEYGLAFKSIYVPSHQNTTLSCWWMQAHPSSCVSVIILHGWGANKSTLLPLAKPFLDLGINVLLVDAHNHGDSQTRGTSTMPKFAEDLVSVTEWLKIHQPRQSQTLIVLGHSVGAAATLLAAANTPQADGYIAIASFAHPQLMMQRQLGKLNAVPGLSWVISAYVQWVIGARFDAIAPLTSVSKIVKPVLCIHGTLDQVIPLSDFKLLCQAATPWVHCVEIAGADHDSIDLIEQHFDTIRLFLHNSLGVDYGHI
ncbi:alpha/beta hydrolase [Thiomicrorhabdus aquaedulcis]|uniref:alpha/beta hydrolase n=1 Tax=Thiomicrorhabdus aquaedulcis TaxID=2211106 RepID=UPI000FDA9BE3|nr:alpha/beta hydrolase [Thiomicrorhabdus aquaedulcis]